MKQESKTAWISAQYLKAGLAISEIEAARKQRCSGYDERLRKLNALTSVLLIKQLDEQVELFDPKEILNPELQKLLESPLHGLD
jgi:hypothetical protein